MKIAIGGDHAGFHYKEKLKLILIEQGYEITDFGPVNEESCDYADIAHPLAESVEKKENQFGIVICGSGNGINMTVNKHQNIRAALCWNEELAKLARQHNDANILSLPARFIDFKTANASVNLFLTTDFEGGRHERRVNKIKIRKEKK